MPRKNSNARQLIRPKKLKAKPSNKVIVERVVNRYADYMSPGRLVAAAEWREIN